MGGYFLQPTIIRDMNSDMLTTREETFAPVVGLYKFETEEEAIDMANDCDVGLGAFIVTEHSSFVESDGGFGGRYGRCQSWPSQRV